MGVLSGLCCSDFLPLPLGMSLAPPSLIMLVLAPPGPLMPVGFLNQSEMPSRWISSVIPSSHSSRKKAIMAVTKSA